MSGLLTSEVKGLLVSAVAYTSLNIVLPGVPVFIASISEPTPALRLNSIEPLMFFHFQYGFFHFNLVLAFFLLSNCGLQTPVLVSPSGFIGTVASSLLKYFFNENVLYCPNKLPTPVPLDLATDIGKKASLSSTIPVPAGFKILTSPSVLFAPSKFS